VDCAEELLHLGQKVFKGRASLLNLWQNIALHFYPERADFTSQRSLGTEFGIDLMSSYPVMVRRDLGDSISSMLRPTSKEWFHQRTRDDWDKVDVDTRSWLEKADKRMRQAMYHNSSNFVRATKEGDHDFASFGQAVIQITLNRLQNGLLYRCWHLRDVAWMEGESGKIDTVFRVWRPSARMLAQTFKAEALHRNAKEKLDKDPYAEIEVWHVVIPRENVRPGKNTTKPFTSYYVDVENKHIIEEVGLLEQEYVIPRWRTVSGSQYAVSPATCVAIPDARMLQSMIGTLMEAGEKAVNPPIVADKQVFRGNFSAYAGGLTWADMGDGRIGDHYQLLPVDKNGIPLGRDMAADVRASLLEAFYINKLNLPPPDGNMTAFEVGQRVQEYIRQAMPLFEPLEYEYNASVCDRTFNIMLRVGAFGPLNDIPEALQGTDTQFTFESPLHDAIERGKMQQFSQARQIVLEALEVDPSTRHVMDFDAAVRDALLGGGTPAGWLRSTKDAAQMIKQDKEDEQLQQILQQQQQVAAADMASAQARQTEAQTPSEDTL
jgi:hypothetical protein